MTPPLESKTVAEIPPSVCCADAGGASRSTLNSTAITNVAEKNFVRDVIFWNLRTPKTQLKTHTAPQVYSGDFRALGRQTSNVFFGLSQFIFRIRFGRLTSVKYGSF